MATAAVSAPLTRAPLLSRAALASLFAQRENLAFAAFAQRQRSGCATLLALAVAEQWISPSDVAAALQNDQATALGKRLGDSLSHLTDWLNQTAATLTFADWPQLNWHHWVRLDLVDDDPLQLALSAEDIWFFAFDLDHLPAALAVAIAQTLDLVMELTEATLLRDMAEGWGSDCHDLYRQFEAAGVAHDADKACDYLQIHPINEYFDWNNSSDLAAWLDSTAAMVNPQAAWLRRYQGQLTDGWFRRGHLGRLAQLTQRRWRWRDCSQWADIQGSPWLRWFDHARRCLRQYAQVSAQPSWAAQDTDILDYDDLEPLGYTQCVSFGEIWEPDFMDDWNHYVAGSSYECGIRIVLRHTQWQRIHHYLSGFAIGQGLLLSAWQADQVSRRLGQRSTT